MITQDEWQQFRKLEAKMKVSAKASGLTLEEYKAGVILSDKPKTTNDIIQELVDVYGLPESQYPKMRVRITQLTNTLESKGFLTKVKDKDDKRKVIFTLTPEGAKKLKEN